MTRAIKSAALERRIHLEEREIDTEARTVRVAFSSELPVDRFFGREILDHDPGSVDLGRLRGGAAVLVNHNPDDHVGVVESASIDRDRIGRAVLRFGKGARASEIFEDVVDGIRSLVSVSYRLLEMELEKSGEEGNTYRATRWEPFEISLVGVPADPSVGVGRAAEGEVERDIIITSEGKRQTMESEAKAPAADQAAKATEAPGAAQVRAAEATATALTEAERQQLRDQTRKDELKRMEEIDAIGREFKLPELAAKGIREGVDVDSFRQLVLEALAQQRAKPLPLDNDIGLNDKEVREFSFLRALRALAFKDNPQFREEAAFELECSAAAGQKRGKPAQGILVPVDVLRGRNFLPQGSGQRVMLQAQAMQRALEASTPTAGGHLVATDLLSADFITLLRNAAMVLQMGAQTFSDLEGNIAIPKQTGGVAAGWITPEGSDSPYGEATFGQVPLSPKTLGANTEYTRQLLMQSSIDLEGFVREDLTIAIGLEWDRASIYGDGTGGAPTGIANQVGVGIVDYAAADPTWPEVVQMETEVAVVNALMGSMGYMVDPTFRGYGKTTLKSTGVAGYIWESGDTVNGYRAGVTNQIQAGDQFFGNWRDLLIAMWGGLDIITDPYTKSTSGNVRVTALQSVDIAVRHAESFVHGSNHTP